MPVVLHSAISLQLTALFRGVRATNKRYDEMGFFVIDCLRSLLVDKNSSLSNSFFTFWTGKKVNEITLK